MEQNIFTKPFSELTADEFLHLMDMVSEECDSHRNCSECTLHNSCEFEEEVSNWYSDYIKQIVEKFREENR